MLYNTSSLRTLPFVLKRTYYETRESVCFESIVSDCADAHRIHCHPLLEYGHESSYDAINWQIMDMSLPTGRLHFSCCYDRRCFLPRAILNTYNTNGRIGTKIF